MRGTGLKKCMPMTRPGDFDVAAILVTEIDEVLVAENGVDAADAVEFGDDRLLDLEFLHHRFDDQVAVAQIGSSPVVAVMRPKAASASAAVSFSRETSRSRLFLIALDAMIERGFGAMSRRTTGKPATAKAWAMPLPIVPAPTTPIRLISRDMPTSLVATSFVLYDRERREPSHFRRRTGLRDGGFFRGDVKIASALLRPGAVHSRRRPSPAVARKTISWQKAH